MAKIGRICFKFGYQRGRETRILFKQYAILTRRFKCLLNAYRTDWLSRSMPV